MNDCYTATIPIQISQSVLRPSHAYLPLSATVVIIVVTIIMAKTISATWTRLISSPELQRSSHTVSAVDNTVYVFGGELQPREPRDNDVHKVTLGGNPVKGRSIAYHSINERKFRDKRENPPDTDSSIM
jgi:hypothetical protein